MARNKASLCNSDQGAVAGRAEYYRRASRLWPKSMIGRLRRHACWIARRSHHSVLTSVNALRRDCVRLDSAEAMLEQLPRWMDDYNGVHPHKGLKMRSPREYLALQRADQDNAGAKHEGPDTGGHRLP